MTTMHSTIDIYIENGIEHIVPGNNDRVQGWATFHEFLKIPDEGIPFIRFTSNCINAIETIPSLVRSSRNPEDVNTDGEDHIADALRYALMFLDKPFIREVQEEKKKWLERLEKKRKSYLSDQKRVSLWAG